MKTLFLSVLLVCGFTANAQTNLLPTQGNFDFEAGSPTNAYWWFLGTNGASANFVLQTAEKHGGNSAYQLNVVTPAADQWRIQVASSYNESEAQYPTLTSGTSYTLRFWLKTANGGGAVRVSNGGSSLWSGDATITQGDWKQYSFTFNGNGGKYKPYLEFGTSAVGTYYIDDIALYETSTLGVTDINKKKAISVYPNPAKDVINLDSETYSSSKTVSIFDATGKNVITTPTSKTINVSKLAKGTYLLTTDKGGTTKFIKE